METTHIVALVFIILVCLAAIAYYFYGGGDGFEVYGAPDLKVNNVLEKPFSS